MKVGDLVKRDIPSGKFYGEPTYKLGLIVDIMLDGCDPPTNTYFVQWVGDMDVSVQFEEDFEVINESR